MTRRFAVLLGITAAPAAWLADDPAWAEEPIRVGFLTVRSDALAAGGRQLEEGFQLFLRERNGIYFSSRAPALGARRARQESESWHSQPPYIMSI